MSLRRETGFAVAASALLHLAAAGLVLWGGGDCAPAPEQSQEGGESRSPSAAPTRVRLVSGGGSGAARTEPSTGGAAGTGAARAEPSSSGAARTGAARAEPSTGGAIRTGATRAESSTAAQPGAPRVEQAPATGEAQESASTEPSAVPSGDAGASGSLANPVASAGLDHDAGEQAPSAGAGVSDELEGRGSQPRPSGAPGTTSGTSAAGPGTVGGGQPGSAQGTAEDFALLQRRLATAATGCYPEQARRMRLQGELRLEFCVDGRGEAIGVRVVGGSGVPLLDRAATDCLIPKAFPVPEVRGGCFQVPVRFGRN